MGSAQSTQSTRLGAGLGPTAVASSGSTWDTAALVDLAATYTLPQRRRLDSTPGFRAPGWIAKALHMGSFIHQNLYIVTLWDMFRHLVPQLFLHVSSVPHKGLDPCGQRPNCSVITSAHH